MNIKKISILLTSILSICGCTTIPDSSITNTSVDDTSVESSSSSHTSSTSSTSTPKKVTVAAHTLSDSNPPIDMFTPGQKVSESTWNSFKNGSASKFNNHYNFTYTAFISYSSYQQQFFTKNGYAYNSLQGNVYTSQYYERKSGTTFYQYVDVSDGWLRQETTFNLVNTFTSRIVDEIKVHMFDFSNYVWNEYQECYVYNGGTFTSVVRFQGGYLSYLAYTLSGGIQFTINCMFDTTIEIPESYYYK